MSSTTSWTSSATTASGCTGAGSCADSDVDPAPRTGTAATGSSRLTPGTALDCCGNEILVVGGGGPRAGRAAGRRRLDPADETLHEIQLCLRYHECGNEPVPVLYDDCGCDDNRCLPNRILESYRIDAVVDPPVMTAAWTGPTLTRRDDLPVPDARRVVVLANGALAVADGTAVHRVDSSGAITATVDLGTAIQGLDVAAGGSLYVTRDDGAGGIVVDVLDGGTLSQTHEKTVAGSAAPASTAVLADGRLAILQGTLGSLAVFGSDLETGSNAAAKKVAVDTDRSLLVVHPVDPVAYVAADAASPTPTRAASTPSRSTPRR